MRTEAHAGLYGRSVAQIGGLSDNGMQLRSTHFAESPCPSTSVVRAQRCLTKEGQKLVLT